MPKDTKSLGNNKAPACESRGFVHKKEGVHFDTPSAISGIWYNSKFKERFVSRFVKSLDEWSNGNDEKVIELFEPNIAPLVIDDKESWAKCEENLFDWLYWYTQKVEGNSVYSPLEALTLYEWYKYMYNSK